MNIGVVERLSKLKGTENIAIAEIVKELCEVDREQSYREAGYSSLFTLCTVGLGYSDGAAYRRIQAARCMRENDEVYEMIKCGRASLCSIAEIARVKEARQREELLKEAPGKSKLEVQKLTSKFLPVVAQRKERVQVRQVEASPAPLFESPTEKPSPVRSYTMTLEVNDEFMNLLNEAKRFTGPVSNSQVVERALRSFVSQKTSPVKRKMRYQSKAKGRFIPREIREAVRRRDQDRCTFMSAGGVRCPETLGLQFDHRVPFSIGGRSTVENLRLLCATHNRLEAERHFGKHRVANHFHRCNLKDGGPKNTDATNQAALGT